LSPDEIPEIKWHFVDLTSAAKGGACSACGKARTAPVHVTYVNEEEVKLEAMDLPRQSSQRHYQTRSSSSKRAKGQSEDKQQFSREKKIAKRLFPIVILFISCWFPFFLAYVLAPFVEKSPLVNDIYAILTWLGE